MGRGAQLGTGLMLALALMGCDRIARPIAVTPQEDPARRLALRPERLVLNVPSEQPCPCPFVSTASLQVEVPAAGTALRWTVSDAAIATVSAHGVVSAKATGTAIVTLQAAGWLPATASLMVVDQGGRAAVTLQ